MSDLNNTFSLSLQDWVLRVSRPTGDGSFPLLLLLHGWTGDEDSMWIFAHHLEDRYIIVSPRGILPACPKGYAWYQITPDHYGNHVDFAPAIVALVDLVTLLPTVPQLHGIDTSRLILMGFSQGAALSYAFSIAFPSKVQSLACLAGFLPMESESRLVGTPLKGKPIFVTHGRKDSIVPIELARHEIELLRQAGAEVHYCESDVGHHASVDCLRDMQRFFLSVQNANDTRRSLI